MEHVRVSDDERTPLLSSGRGKPKRTPLPKQQIALILLLQICEPICSHSIYPYINELVSTLDIIGGDTRKIGYYAGFIESLFFAAEALTVFQWSRLSDCLGRKPVLMIGLVGIIISMLLFGLSRTFLTLVISRCVCGLLNGNVEGQGVLKSAMGELTDSSNRADAYALLPAVWAFGATVGPLMGGLLARPADRFPISFSKRFWSEYPYFLPCLASSAFVLASLLVTGVIFNETSCKFKGRQSLSKKNYRPSLSDTLIDTALEDDLEEIPLRKLLSFPVVISISNYVTLAFLGISLNAIFPLFLHMPFEMGGLHLRPADIGYIMGIYGAGTGVFQIVFFARLVGRFGVRRMFITSLACYIPLFLLFPIINLIARKYAFCWGVWVLLSSVVSLMAFMETAYGCVFMYVTESAPNRRCLGATNGLAQTTVSIARAIGPALSTSLYSLSIERRILGGYGVYTFLAFLSSLALMLAVQLPPKLWSQIRLDDAEAKALAMKGGANDD